MKPVYVRGVGAISPAGWGIEPLLTATRDDTPIATTPLARPGWEQPIAVRKVPPPAQRPAYFTHPRLRRVSAISRYVVGAALEALGDDLDRVKTGRIRLGIIASVMPGCVSYSRRFFEEVMRDPATASPLVFPETVFNAPASHLCAYLNSTAPSYTLAGDASATLLGLALGVTWLANDWVDGCLVAGAEEMDWVLADANRLFDRDVVQSEGSGAIYLSHEPGARTPARLERITDAFNYVAGQDLKSATVAVREQLRSPVVPTELLCLSTLGTGVRDAHELDAWKDWSGGRVSPGVILGQANTATSAWQCAIAVSGILEGKRPAANVSVVGVNHQAIGSRFVAAS